MAVVASRGPRVERLLLVLALLAVLVPRVLRVDQPIVENYVGRQVPTAMVARNLERGSGFLRPRLDTGPFPNLFLVEPPVYASAAVALRRLSGLRLAAAGRVVSALATTLGAWGLFGLARRREGFAAALLAVVAFAALPVTIRYGRAFQPDALMLGSMLAGLRFWDDHEATGGLASLAAGWGLIATALALKVISAYILLVLMVAIVRPPRFRKAILAATTLLPALLWYAHARGLLATGSRASADNAAIWMRSLAPGPITLAGVAGLARLILRAFGPIALGLALWGGSRPGRDRLWTSWAVSAALALAVLARKAHHEYYWLALAPVVAVATGRALAGIAGSAESSRSRLRPAAAAALGLALVAGAIGQAAGTFATPGEWRGLAGAAAVVAREVPPGSWLVAPEALLWASDRRGCRLEVDGPSARRAAGEWSGRLVDAGPLGLIEFYRRRGAAFVALPRGGPDDPARAALRGAIRRRYRVLRDDGRVLLAALSAPSEVTHADR